MFSTSRNDITLLILSGATLLAAIVISWFTMANRSRGEAEAAMHDPYQMAAAAARAGVDAATWHIQCHGRAVRGSLGKRYFINGATYEASWGDVNLADSTVTVKSIGSSDLGGGQGYNLEIVKTVKLEFMPAHANNILTGYYTD